MQGIADGLDPALLIALAVAAVVSVTLLGLTIARLRRQALPPPMMADGAGQGASVDPPALDENGVASRFFRGLAKTRERFGQRFFSALGPDGKVNAAGLQRLEEALISADVGVRAAQDIGAAIQKRAAQGATVQVLRGLLGEELRKRIGDPAGIAAAPDSGPLVILVVGVNGSGKTTTIGKLAARYQRAGKKVLLGAGDTFRAGAIEQLKVWGERSGVPVVAHQEGGDPAAVIFDAIQAARARNIDVVICDTAGRLQAQKTLMDELGKVVRVMDKALPGAPHEVLLVLDATIGQNALSQARIFKEVVGVTGVVLTKLDGTARGGVVVAVRDEMGIPVKLVGLGEGIDDLRDFDPDAFVAALVGSD